MANTIRLSAFNRRRETAIMRLVGASKLLHPAAFLLEGTIAGCSAGHPAGLLVAVSPSC